MGKIWIKGPDSSRQCCECEGKSSPCDSCCPAEYIDHNNLLENTALFPSGTVEYIALSNAVSPILSKDGINGVTLSFNKADDFYFPNIPFAMFYISIKSGYYMKMISATEPNQITRINKLTCGKDDSFNYKYGGICEIKMTNGNMRVLGLPDTPYATFSYSTFYTNTHYLDRTCGGISQYYLEYGQSLHNTYDVSLDQITYSSESLIYVAGDVAGKRKEYTPSVTISVQGHSTASYFPVGGLAAGCAGQIPSGFFCKNSDCSERCDQQPTYYSYSPPSISAPNIEPIIQTQLLKIDSFSGYSYVGFTGSTPNSACMEVFLYGNASFYLYDQNMNPVDITGLMLKFKFLSLP